MTKQKRAPRRRSKGGRDGISEPDFIMASPQDVLRAFERFDPSAGWERMAPSLVPLLPRRSPSPIRVGAPLQSMLGPEILAGFGIDFGPAVAAVTRELVERWEVDDAVVVARALANVRALAAELPPEVVKRVDLEDGASASVLQSGGGWASALLLVPDLVPRFFGPGPHLVGAPCRDVLLAFAVSTPLDLVRDLVEGLSLADPVGLAPACYVHRDGVLEQLPPAPPGSLMPVDLPLEERPRYVS